MLRHWERATNQAQFARLTRAVVHIDLDDIEAHRDAGIAQQAQILAGATGKMLPLLTIYRDRSGAELVAGARLDLDKCQHLAVARHQVNLAVPATKLADQNLVALPAQMTRRRALTALAFNQVSGLR